MFTLVYTQIQSRSYLNHLVYEAEWVSETAWTGAENLAPTGIRSPVCPARNESLYRLSYPGSSVLN